MNRSAWKHAERRVARELGGERVPVSGRGRGDQPDVRHDQLAVEVKSRGKLPDWLHQAMQQAEAAVRGDQVPVAILHESGRRYADALVLVRLKDLERLGLLSSEKVID